MPIAPILSRLRTIAAAALLALGGCASLPSSGPTARAIVAASHAASGAGFTLREITPEVVAEADRAASGMKTLSNLPAAARSDVIGPGDSLQVTVFEIGAALFSQAGVKASADAPAAAGQSLPLIVVATDGKAMVPYVGRITAAGLTPDALAERIEAALAGKSQAPQVVVSIREPLSNTVLVMGDVHKPGRVLLTPAGERLLDAVALAGGPLNPTIDNTVRLVRGGQAAEASLAAIHPGAAEDVVLQPQDRVEVTYQPRTFTIFGAAGKVAEVPFSKPRVSLAEALARGGGPSEQFADPAAVFVFRYEPAGLDGERAATAMPVAYRLNLAAAQGYFLAQDFEMKPHDVVYVAGADSNQPVKLLQILNLLFQPIYTGKVLAQ